MNQYLKYLLITIIPLSFYTGDILAQENFRGAWNLQEKDSLLKYAKEGKYYKGIIWNYNSTMHELIPQGSNTYQYVRTNKYKQIQCNYENIDATDVVIKIFSELSGFNGSSDNCRTNDVPIFNRFRIVGRKNDQILGYYLTEDENFKRQTTLVYVNLYEKNETGEIMETDSLSPIAQLDNFKLHQSIKSSQIYLENNDILIKIKGLSSDQIQRNENFNPDVILGKDKFYLQFKEQNNQSKIVSIDPQTGEMDTIIKNGYAPRFYKDHLYYMAVNGLIKMNLKNKKISQVLDYDQLDAINVKTNYIIMDGQLIWGNEVIFLAHIDFLQSFKFSELKHVKARLKELQKQLSDSGFEEYELLDPVVEHNSDEEPAVKMTDLPDNEQKIISEIKVLREKRKELQRKLSEQMKAGYLAGKAKRGVMPEEYKLMQHPVTQEPIFVTNQIGWPIYTWKDIIMLPPVMER